MSKKVFALVISLVLLCGCGDNAADNRGSDAAGQETVYQITDLGICSDGDAALPMNARNPWDLTVVEGKVYVAGGDYDANTGPTAIWAYEAAAQQWVSTGYVRQEAVARFVELQGQTVALGTDPMGDGEYADCYVLQDGTWNTYARIQGALHVFDAAVYDGAVYYGLGCGDDLTVVVKQQPQTGEMVTVPLYKAGVDAMAALAQTANVESKRVYDFFTVGDRFFCAFSCAYTTGKTTVEFFELRGDKFVFCQTFKNAGLQMNKAVKNQVLLNGDAVFENRCYLSFGDLYQTADFIQFDKVDVPGNDCVTDLWVEKDNGRERLYVLTAAQTEGGYRNVIFEMAEGQLTEVFAFNSAVGAVSLAKDGAAFYVGCGGDEVNDPNVGRIYKISK